LEGFGHEGILLKKIFILSSLCYTTSAGITETSQEDDKSSPLLY